MSLREGRVIGHEKDRYRIYFDEQLTMPAIARSRLFHDAVESVDLPVVGDRVQCLTGDSLVTIEEVLPRRSLLVRKGADERGPQAMAANVDFVLIATSLNQDLSLNRLERYVTFAADSGAKPVLVLTKKDLSPNWDQLLADVASRMPGIPVHAIERGKDLSALVQYCSEDRCSVVVGSSGVGKSTLINGLLGEERLKTQSIREDDAKGRHTTTSRSMWKVSGGGWLIDTPGLRELQMLDHEEGLEQAFEDVIAWAANCKFGNCTHVKEPKCGVRAAIESGLLSEERWQSYLKLEREVAFQKRRVDKVAASEEKAKWKRIHKQAKKDRK